MASQITIGNVRIVSLCDAIIEHPIPLDRLFPSVPAEGWEDYRQRYPRAFGGPNVWQPSAGCYLLRSQATTILVDTGIGAAGGPIATSLQVPGGGRLLQKLHSLGLSPEEVDLVILTHLHRDHVGWNVRGDSVQRRLTFPRARYVVHQNDWETFHRPEVQAAMPSPYVDGVVTPLESLRGLDLTPADRGITDEVTAIHTPGHTPGHMSVLVASCGQRAIITGDVVVHPAQIADPDCAFHFDMNVEAARQMRHRLLERIEAEGMTVVAGHFPEPGFGRLVRVDGCRQWQAL